MRRRSGLALVVPLAITLAACERTLDPVSPLRPPQQRASTIAAQPPAWRGHWQSGQELWVYDQTPELGMNSHLHNGNRMHESFDQIQGAGIRLVRTSLDWGRAENSRGVYNTLYLDGDFGYKAAVADSKGMELVAVVHAGNLRDPAAGEDLATFNAHITEFLTFVVAYYPNVKYWQIWNEQDHPTWSGPWNHDDANLRGHQYAQTLRAIRHLFGPESGRWIVLGGLEGILDPNYNFLVGMYDEMDAVGGKPYPFDIMAYHAYGASPWTPYEGPMSQVWKIREIMNAHGDANRPIWLTETGTGGEHYDKAYGCPASSPGQTYDDHQLGYYQGLIGNLSSIDVAKVFPYVQWNSTVSNPSSTCIADPANYGVTLYRSDEITPRPAMQWLTSRAATTMQEWNHSTWGSFFVGGPKVPKSYPWEYLDDGTIAIGPLTIGTLTPTRIEMREPFVYQAAYTSGIGWHVYRGNNEVAVAGDQVIEAIRIWNSQLPPDVHVLYSLRSEQGIWSSGSDGSIAGDPNGWISGRANRAKGIRIWLVDPQPRGISICYSVRTIASPVWSNDQYSCDGTVTGTAELINGLKIRIYNPQWRF